MSSGRSWILGGALLTALGSLSLGCGGIAPGDYIIYRVAFAEESKSTGCYYPFDAVQPDDKSDSTTFLGKSQFILYAGLEDVYYLDVGGDVVLEGTGDGDTFQFSGKTVDVNYAVPDGTGDKTTATFTTTIDMAIDGASVSGTAVTKDSFSCKGSTCGDARPTCTETSEFVGTEVEDVQLEHGI